MAGTHSKYPESLDILDRFADGVGFPNADTLNILADAARQLQVVLGVDPVDGNFPAGSASDWASLSTVQDWMARFFRMEMGTFEIDIPIESEAAAWGTDYSVYYSNINRFSHTNALPGSLIPHFIGVTFDPVKGGDTDVQGAIAYQPMSHVNRIYNASSGIVQGFTLRNNDSWGNADYYRDMTITGSYWAFEPQYHS